MQNFFFGMQMLVSRSLTRILDDFRLIAYLKLIVQLQKETW